MIGDVAEPKRQFVVMPEVGGALDKISLLGSGVEDRGNDLLESEKIETVLRMVRPSVTVIGLGGAGNNIISWIKQRGISGGKLIAANTDAAFLSITKADRRILMGEKLMHGQGSGGYPERGALAARDSLQEFLKETQNSNIIFICAGLGGGTGTGSAGVLARELRRPGRLVIGVVTLPFSDERYSYRNARNGLMALRSEGDTVVAIDNRKLSKVAGGLPLQKALGVANNLIGQFVKGITEAITTASLMNIDYADLRAITERKGLAAIGVGEAEGADRVETAVRTAIEGQLLDIRDIKKSQGALMFITGGQDITLEEVTKAGELVTKMLPSKVRIVWGARVDPTLVGRVRATVVLTGIEASFFAWRGYGVYAEAPKMGTLGQQATRIESEERVYPPAVYPSTAPAQQRDMQVAKRSESPDSAISGEKEKPIVHGYDKIDESKSSPDRVFLGASVPASAHLAQRFTARFVAYVEEREEIVREILEKLSSKSMTTLGIKRCRWKRGTLVRVRLQSDPVSIAVPQKEFVWDGDYNIVDFDCEVPQDAPIGDCVIKFDVLIAGFIVAELRLNLSITRARLQSRRKSVTAEPAKTAFASYASEDRVEVLGRIASLENYGGLDVFKECLSLHPGDDWKAKISSEIPRREKFLLFWSTHARESEWVSWEWHLALAKPGKKAMQIHPLQTVSEAPPPAELADLHFGDPLMYIRKAYEWEEEMKQKGESFKNTSEN